MRMYFLIRTSVFTISRLPSDLSRSQVTFQDPRVCHEAASYEPDEATFSLAVHAAARAKNFTMLVEWLREVDPETEMDLPATT